MVAHLVDRMATLVPVRRFLGMGVAESRSLRSNVFGGMCNVNSCNVFLLLFMVLWAPISATLCRRAVLTLWHAFLFLGLRFFSLFFFLLGGLHSFFL
jgi:hypothetical protein